jgi:hypothetical protein
VRALVAYLLRFLLSIQHQFTNEALRPSATDTEFRYRSAVRDAGCAHLPHLVYTFGLCVMTSRTASDTVPLMPTAIDLPSDAHVPPPECCWLCDGLPVAFCSECDAPMCNKHAVCPCDADGIA